MKTKIILALIIATTIFIGCSKEEDTPTPAPATTSTTSTGTGFDLSDVDEFDIDEVNIISFDFASQTEPDLEFYTDIWDGSNWVYLGSDVNCIESQTEAADLPVDVICNEVTILNAQFQNSIDIEIWDEDQNSNDDNFGTVSFTPTDHITSISGNKTITLTDGGNVGYTVQVVISW
jgi:hypothetical protein